MFTIKGVLEVTDEHALVSLPQGLAMVYMCGLSVYSEAIEEVVSMTIALTPGDEEDLYAQEMWGRSVFVDVDYYEVMTVTGALGTGSKVVFFGTNFRFSE
jgi:hypothetical protein